MIVINRLPTEIKLKIVLQLKITPDFIEIINDYMEASKEKRVVVSDIQDYIKNFHIKYWPISSSTIRRILKNHFKISYRKAENKIRKSFTDEYKRKLFETIQIVESLKNDRWELIYFDEFNYNFSTYKHYNWDVKGNKNYLIGTSET